MSDKSAFSFFWNSHKDFLSDDLALHDTILSSIQAKKKVKRKEKLLKPKTEQLVRYLSKLLLGTQLQYVETCSNEILSVKSLNSRFNKVTNVQIEMQTFCFLMSSSFK